MKKFVNSAYEEMKNVTGLRLSPDGRHALYTVTHEDIAADGMKAYLWLLDTASGKSRRLTHDGRTGSAIWLDSGSVLFAAARSEEDKNAAGSSTAFYRLPIDGGEAEKYMTVPLAGAQLSVIGRDDFLVRATRDAGAADERPAAKWVFYDEYPFQNDAAGYVNKKRRTLYRWDARRKKLTQLTPDLMQTYMPFCSSDVIMTDDGFYYVGHIYDRDSNGMAGVYKHIWATGENREIFTCQCYVFSIARRDGRIWAGVFVNEKGADTGLVRIVSADENGGGLRTEAQPDWGLEYVTQGVAGDMFIRCRRSETAMCRWLGGHEYEEIATPGVYPSFAAATEQGVLLLGREKNRMQEVYLHKNGRTKRLTRHNDPLYRKYAFSEPESLTVSSGGWEIDGWVLRPAGFEAGKKYPGILSIHGGPHGHYSDAFYSEMQRWASEGYFVFYCNPRGSTSYDWAFGNVSGAMGVGDYEDIMAFTDGVLAEYPELDGDRLAVTGQSYGGYMTNWVIGHTDRFRAAAARMSISNWVTMHATSNERWYGDSLVGADPWSDLEKVWQHSPLKYADRVKTPTLLIQHGRDGSTPPEQAEQMFVALLERGVPVKMMVNLEASHGGRTVSQKLHDIDVMLKWFGEYLK